MPRSVGIQWERVRVSVFSVVIFISIYHRHGILLSLNSSLSEQVSSQEIGRYLPGR